MSPYNIAAIPLVEPTAVARPKCKRKLISVTTGIVQYFDIIQLLLIVVDCDNANRASLTENHSLSSNKGNIVIFMHSDGMA